MDFHYTVDGQVYTFTLPGGGYLPLEELLTALGITADDPETEEDEADAFMAFIGSAEMSDPSLVFAVKAQEETTVGALKEANALECVYSAELTPEEIAAIDARAVAAGEWGLISVLPFETEEVLTVTMKDGAQFAVRVTDAQISVDVLTAGGETYTITVEYGDDAEIPDGAELRAAEIAAGSDEYMGYLNAASEKLGADSESIYLARFFDIRIVETVDVEERELEPKVPVKVTIALKEELREEDSLSVVHFLPEGPQRIDDAQLNELDDVEFTAESFSVYGVITMPAPTGADDLDGRTFTMSIGGRYVTDQAQTPLSGSSNTNGLGKTINASEAAQWRFEQVSGSTYRIVNTDDGRYLTFTKNPEAQSEWNTRAHATLTDDGTVFTVEKVGSGYRISALIDGTTYYLDEHNGSTGPGFAGWYIAGDNNTLTLNFTQPVLENDKEYMVIVKKDDQYFVVLNDGSMERVTYNEDDGSVTVDDPMLWTYTGSNLYHHSTQVAYDGNKLPTGFYYRYIDATAVQGWSEDPANAPLNNEGTNLREPRSQMAATALAYENGKLRSTVNPSDYIGVEQVDGKWRIKGQATESEAVEVLLADAVKVPSVGWTHHTVNHIDISIQGTTSADVPLAYGKYYDENHNVVMDVSTFQKLTLTEDQVKDKRQLEIEVADMKRATIRATVPGENGPVDLNDAFYLAGYSANDAYNEGGESGEHVSDTVQVRVEGSFKVANLDGTEYETVDANRYNNDETYKNAVNQARLNNKVTYSVTVVKPITFSLEIPVLDDNDEPVLDADGKPTYIQLYDADGEPLTVTADVAFSASFDFWDKRNECPPLQGNNYGFGYDKWQAGEIWQIVDRIGGCGMDFRLGATAQTDVKVYAVEITKMVVDENGSRIRSYDAGGSSFGVYKTSQTSDDVKDLNVGSVTTNPLTYPDSQLLHTKTVSIGEDGLGLVYDYDVTPGVYYITEDPDSIEKTITDLSGKEWSYKETYILTEYAWRNHSNDNYMHVSPTYSGEEEYAAVPEILGDHYGYNGTDGPYTNDFLEFYVYNVYESPKVDVPVIKTWADFEQDDAHTWQASFKLQWAPIYPDERAPSVAFQDVSPAQTMTVTKEKMAGIDTTLVQQYLANDETLTDEQKNAIEEITFKNLPKYGTDAHGNTFRYQYSLEETSYRVINTTTGVVEYSWSKDEGYNDPEASTHYQPFYPHDAGEIKTDEDEAAENTNYYIEVRNEKKNTREKEYINVSLSKQWDSSFGTPADDWFAEFELRRFEHTEYRDLSMMSDADKTADPITVTIQNGANEVYELWVQPNMGLYLGGNFKPHDSERTVTFTANPAVRLANGSNTTTLTVTAGGQNMSNALVRSPEFFVTRDTVFTLTSGGENLVEGNLARVLDTGAGTNPLPDRSYSRTVRLNSENGWQVNMSDLLLNETTEGENDNENVTCYEYYFVEKSSNPDGYAQFFRANSDGTPSAILSGDSDHQIETDDSIVAVNGPSNRLHVKKLWRGVPDTTGFPAVTFTLYQTDADNNIGQGHVYENEQGTRYEHIELKGNALEWICPEVLPQTRTDNNGQSHRLAYYILEDEDSRSGSSTKDGITTSWKFYYYINSNGKQYNAAHQGYEVGLYGDDLAQNGGTITICNELTQYEQLHIRKKFFELKESGAWDDTTSHSERKNGIILGFKVLRAIKTADGKYINEQGNLVDSRVWMDYGDEMLCGYDNNGTAIVQNTGENKFWLKHAGSEWMFRIEDNQGDVNNVNTGGSGLPKNGYYILNGEDIPVTYEYTYRETNVYQFVSQDGENGAITVTDYPQWDWFSSVLPMEHNPIYQGRIENAIANFQASNLIIDKEWIGEPNAKAVYVKIWRTSGGGAPEDFTAVIADDIRNNHNWQMYVSNTSAIDTNRKCLVIEPDANGNWTADIKVNRALLGALAETGKYSYYIQEIGYRDAQGTYKTNVNSTYRPLYDHWVDGSWTNSPVQMNEYADNSIQIGAKGENRLKVINRNTESTSYTATKTFLGTQGSTGGQSTINGYPTDGSKQVVIKLQQRYRYEKTENGVDYVSATGADDSWILANTEFAASTWTQDWQDAESASPLYVTLPLPKPAGSVLSDSAWYGSAAAWTYTWEGLDVKKLMSGSEESGNAVYAQLYYRAVEQNAPQWFDAVISAEDGHKAVDDASQTQQQILAEKNSIANQRKEVELDLTKEWTSLTGSPLEWPDDYTIDYQLVQHYHLVQVDMSDPENPSYSIGETFKSVDMSTSFSDAQTADNVHPQAKEVDVGKPTDGTNVIAKINSLPMFGYYTATAEDEGLTPGVVYPVVYTYGAKETAVKKNGTPIPFNGQTVDSERDETKTDSILYKATLINELDEFNLTVKKKWTKNGQEAGWPNGAVIYYTVEQVATYTPEGEEPIELERTPILTVDADHSENALTTTKPEYTIEGLHGSGLVTLTEPRQGLSAGDYPVKYTYVVTESAASVPPTGSSYVYNGLTAQLVTDTSDDDAGKYVITNDYTDVKLEKEWKNNGADTAFPDGYKVAWKLIRTDSKGNKVEVANSGKFTKTTNESGTVIALDTSFADNADNRLTKEKTSIQMPFLPTKGVVEGEEVTYAYQFVEDPGYSEKPENSTYTFQAVEATAADAADEDGFVKYTLTNDLTSVEVIKTWEGTPNASSVTVKLYRTTDIPADQLCQVTVNVSFGTYFDKITDNTITATVAGKTVTLTKDGDNDLWTGTVGLERGTSANITFTTPAASDGYTVALDNPTITVADAETQTVNITGSVTAIPVGRTITLNVNWEDGSNPAISYNNLFYDGWGNTNITATVTANGSTRTLVWSGVPESGSNMFIQLGYSDKTMSNYDVTLTGASVTSSVNGEHELLINGILANNNDLTINATISEKQQGGGNDTKTLAYTVNNNSSMGDSDGFWFNVKNAVYNNDNNWWGPFNSATQIGSFNVTKYDGSNTRTFESSNGAIVGFMLQYGSWAGSNTISFSGTGVQSEGSQLVFVPADCNDFEITINPTAGSRAAKTLRTQGVSAAPMRAAVVPTSVIVNMTHPTPQVETSYVNAPDVSGMGDPIDEQVITASSTNADGTVSWYYKWSNLPTKDPETGATYHYYVVEETPANTQAVTYTRTESSSGTTVTIHNTPVVYPSYASFAVMKRVVDGKDDPLEISRDFTIRLNRTKNGTMEWLNYTDSSNYSWGAEATATTWKFNNGGSVTFTGLDTGYTYTAVEDTGTGMVGIDGYTFVPSTESNGSIIEATVTASNAQEYTGTITNKYELATGSVQVKKIFEFPEGSGLTVPEGFKVTATWKIDDEHVYSYDLTTSTAVGTVEDTTYQVSAVEGNGSETEPYTWTISGLPLDTVVTFTESGYQIAGYVVTTTLDPTNGEATAAIEPGTVTITNEYTPGVELPSTGGPGTILYTTAGLGLMALAILALLLKRRKEQMN